MVSSRLDYNHFKFLCIFSMMTIILKVTTSNCSIDTPATIFFDVEQYLKIEAIDVVNIAGSWKQKKPNSMVIKVKTIYWNLHENHLVQDPKLFSIKTSKLIEHIQNT